MGCYFAISRWLQINNLSFLYLKKNRSLSIFKSYHVKKPVAWDNTMFLAKKDIVFMQTIRLAPSWMVLLVTHRYLQHQRTRQCAEILETLDIVP